MASAVPARGAAESARTRGRRDRNSMVGRQRELTALTDALASIASRGVAIRVIGEPGIGVTAILRAATEHAAASSTVLTSTGNAAESGLPFAVLHRLLQPILPEIDQLPTVQRQAMHTAFGLAAGPPPDPFLVALGTLTLLTAAAATRPVVAVVDNLEWLDQASTNTLTFIARRISRLPIALIGGVREGFSDPAYEVAFSSLSVSRLDDDSARRLLGDASPHLAERQRDRILSLAAGHPLALLELAAHPPAAHDPLSHVTAPPWISPHLERTLLGQLEGLPAITRDALLIAAIHDTTELAEILAATAVFSQQQVSAAVFDPAEQRQLLQFDELHVAFRHPLARPAIVQRESVVRRQAAHRAWGAALSEPSARRSWHRALSATGCDDSIADELEAIAREATGRGQLPTAIAALEKSASLTTGTFTRARRLLTAAEHCIATGRREHAELLSSTAQHTGIDGLNIIREELLRAAPMADIPADRAGVARLSGMYEDAVAAGDLDLAIKALSTAAQQCWWATTPAPDRARVAILADRSYRAHPDARSVLAMALAEPIRRGSQVIAILDEMELSRVADPTILRVLGLAAHAVGDVARAADLSSRAEPGLRQQGRTGALAHALGVASTAQLDLGEWAGAATTSAEGSELAREAGQLIGSAGAAVNQARILALRGHPTAAMHQVAEVEYHPRLRTLNNFLCRAQIVRGIAWIAAGRHADAFHALKRVFEAGDPSHHDREQLGAIMYLAEAAARCDQRDEAHAIIARMEELTAVTNSPLLIVHLLYARAVLAEDSDAEPLYAAALRADLTRWPWIFARLQLAYGSWLRRQQRKFDARPLLRSALATLTDLGATTWASQARGELNATGAHAAHTTALVNTEPDSTEPDSTQPDNTIGLSAQEKEIAHLAAAGLSNAEIGQQLGLSARTVSSHLYRIFPKLRITSRTQLAGLIHPPSSFTPR